MKQIIFELTENEKQTIYGGEERIVYVLDENGIMRIIKIQN